MDRASQLQRGSAGTIADHSREMGRASLGKPARLPISAVVNRLNDGEASMRNAMGVLAPMSASPNVSFGRGKNPMKSAH